MPEKCSIDGCESPRDAREMCKLHYNRWKRHGDPLAGRTKNGAAPAFIRYAKTYKGDDCLLWPYAKTKGYACIRINQKAEYVCQIICEHAHGPSPTGKRLTLHSCDNGALGCINPRHLRWGSPAENVQDMMDRGRHHSQRSRHADVDAATS